MYHVRIIGALILEHVSEIMADTFKDLMQRKLKNHEFG